MANNSNFRRRKWVIIVIVLGAVIGGGIWYLAKGKGSAAEYQTAPVTRGDLVQIVTASGQLNPVLNVQVGSQISGRIKALYVDFNSLVKSNQVIAQIDSSTYQMSVLRAQADLSNAVANLALAQVQARRADVLYENRLIAAADHDTTIAQLQQAQAAVESSTANLESAQVDLSRCTIYAPVDGVVISRAVDVGQTVAASFNTPTLFLIANDLSKMQIDALISEADIGTVATNQKVNFTVDAYPYRTFHGMVSQIRYGPITNQNVVNYDAIVQVDNSDLKLLPGMTANVSVIVAERENTLKIPNAALRFRPPETTAAASTTNIAPQRVNGAERAGLRQDGPAGGGSGRGGFGAGGPGGGFRGRRGSAGGAPGQPHAVARTIYVLTAGKNPQKPELTPVQARTGINDGASTEVIDGLKEGDLVVTGLLTQDSASSSQPQSNPFGGGRRRF
jgi:HlyD family secretion protein